MTASPKTILRRESLAVDAGSPPDEFDTANFTLCRRTQRSHHNLLSVASLVEGDYVAFLESVGYDAKANPTRNLDNSYWFTICKWIAIYLPAFEKELNKMADELTLPDPKAITENLIKGLGLPATAAFLAHFSEHRDEIRTLLDNLRPDIGMMAELKLYEQVAIGDPATIRWLLPRAMPKHYNLQSSSSAPAPENIRVIFGDGDGDDE